MVNFDPGRQGYGTPMFCSDCYVTVWRSKPSEYSDEAESLFKAGSDAFWEKASKHCNDTDVMPLHCDHLVLNSQSISGALDPCHRALCQMCVFADVCMGS